MSVVAPAEGTAFASTNIGGVEYPANLLSDLTGTDAMGLVSASPAANTLLGRLKAIADAVGRLFGAQGHFAITPSDSVDFSTAARGIYVGTAGNVAIVSGGVAVTYVAVPAGTTLPIAATRVNSTNTTASNLVGMI